jgi:membrane fusion protein, multidrug efflux system
MQERMSDRKPSSGGLQTAASAPPRPSLLSKRGWGLLAAIIVLVMAGLVYAYWQHQVLYPSTDNAQVEANIIQIAPLATGLITKVNVHEYANVKSGDVLFEIDKAPFEGELKLAEARLTIAQQQAQSAPAQQAATAKGNVAQSEAAVEKAKADLDHATVKAPVDGTVGKVRIQPGDIAKAGISVFPLVDTATWWVDANFKETDLSRLKVGQPAKISLDIYPGRTLSGTVEAISRASGSAFSLMPAENATGSWVKVVQRFPVRIAITLDPNDPPLGVGASASVTVDTTSEGKGSGSK